MPGEDGGDTTWFARQNKFEQQELRHQVKYKREVLKIADDGRFAKQPEHMYPHILPDATDLRRVFYAPLADCVLGYLTQEDIQQHTELLNLKSSQAACLNFLFPLKISTALATTVLTTAGILEAGAIVTGIEFEYTAQEEMKGDKGCTEWLGEPPGGKRGQNRTSIDAAIFWNKDGRKCATLVEWKYTERNFGSCSAFGKAKKPQKQPCLGGAYEKLCIITDGKRNHDRNYWRLLAESGIDLDKMKAVSGCPFRGPFYQLMRQFLVASYMRSKLKFNYVDVIDVHFHGNEALCEMPDELLSLATASDTTIVGAWNSVLADVPAMREIEVQKLMSAYDASPQTDPDWRKYIQSRYNI